MSDLKEGPSLSFGTKPILRGSVPRQEHLGITRRRCHHAWQLALTMDSSPGVRRAESDFGITVDSGQDRGSAGTLMGGRKVLPGDPASPWK